jgi:hypothetical protein
MTLWLQDNNFTAVLGIPFYKGQPGARSSHLRRVQGRVRPLWVLCMQSFPAFLQDCLDFMTSWSKVNSFTAVALPQGFPHAQNRANMHRNGKFLSY